MLSDEKLKNMREGCIKYNAWPAESILELLDEIERLKAKNEKLKAVYDAHQTLLKCHAKLGNEFEVLRKAGDEMAEASDCWHTGFVGCKGTCRSCKALDKWREATKGAAIEGE